MIELKSVLKQAKRLLGDGENQRALGVMQELLNNDVKDYMLFCFAALAYANLDEVARAKLLYEEAIKLDSKVQVAWQGLYKLYSSGKLVIDDRSVEVCTHLAALSDSDEKRQAIEDCRRRFYFELCRYDQLQEDLGTNSILLGNIIERLAGKEILSSSELTLCSIVFKEVKDLLRTNSEWDLLYCKFLYKNGNKEWRKAVYDFCNCHPYANIVWIRERLLEILSIEKKFILEYFCKLTIANEIANLYSNCEVSMCDMEKRTSQLINFLWKNDICSALDITDEIAGSLPTFLPLAMIFVHLLAKVENWEQVVKVVDWIQTQRVDDCCQDVACCLKIRAFLGMNNVEEAIRTPCPSSCVLPSFLTDFASVKLMKGENLDELIEHYDPLSTDAKRIRILRALYNGTPDEAVADAESILNNELTSWHDFILLAELNIALSKDATSLLVKAGRMNPYSSRVCYLLGRALCRKKPEKARICLERAVKIRPTNEEYIRALDDDYREKGESVELRLALLNGFCEYSKPLWVRKRLVALCKAKKDWDTVISELQHIVREFTDDVVSWADLAEAYSNRGNLQSSVNAYERVLEIDPKSHYAICLIQVLMRMHNLKAAAEQCALWRSFHGHDSAFKNAVDLLDAQVHLHLFDSAVGNERYQHMETAFYLLDIVISGKPRISLAYKLAADAIFRVLKFQDELIIHLRIPSGWSISSRLSAVRSAIKFYSVALHLNDENPWSWKDLAVALLYSAHVNNSSEDAVKALECLRKALSLCKCIQMRSQIWTLIAEAERLSAVGSARNNCRLSAALQQHYLVRALQLNKANGEAWLRLALLYYTNGAMDQSHMAIETALKHNPQLAEAWCAWALKADSEGLTHESMDMFRHSISIKPIASAVMKYSAYLCQTMETSKFDPATVMIDFNKVLRLREGVESQDKNLLLHMGVLAELFGNYDDAVDCVLKSGHNGYHLQRAQLKAGQTVLNLMEPLKKLGRLCALSAEELLSILKKEQLLYKDLFERLVTPEAEGLQELFSTYSKSISIPLVVAAIIRFEMTFLNSVFKPVSDEAIAILHDVLPRHELIDVFPTIMPEGMDNGLKYLTQDGEEPFRYSHYVAKPLLEVLRKCRDELESDKQPISV